MYDREYVVVLAKVWFIREMFIAKGSLFYAPDYLPPSASALRSRGLRAGDNQGSKFIPSSPKIIVRSRS